MYFTIFEHNSFTR